MLRAARFPRRAALAVAALLLALPAHAEPVADFYAGKTLRVLVGFSAGGGYDLYARTLARYLGALVIVVSSSSDWTFGLVS